MFYFQEVVYFTVNNKTTFRHSKISYENIKQILDYLNNNLLIYFILTLDKSTLK